MIASANENVFKIVISSKVNTGLGQSENTL